MTSSYIFFQLEKLFHSDICHNREAKSVTSYFCSMLIFSERNKTKVVRVGSETLYNFHNVSIYLERAKHI